MINIQTVLGEMPHFETFCSVDKLHGLIERVGEDLRFEIRVAGKSVNGVPIHHVRFGSGPVKVLVVGLPHCNEPIGSLTVFSLLWLLKQRNRALVEADVEWHIVPCIDPDGAKLNEGWSQKPFTLQNYMKHYYLQAARDQVDGSFPITYKKLVVADPPSPEARVLQSILHEVKPDLYFSLHNTRTGGAFYYVSRDLGQKYYRDIYDLLERNRFPIQKRPQWKEICAQYSVGIVETITLKKYYDYLEKTTPNPEKLLPYGAPSWEYLPQVKPDALTFIAEMGYARHPSDESETPTGQNLRQFKLRIDADSKYLATILLEEWGRLKDELDPANPFYRAIVGGRVLPDKEKLNEGGTPVSRYPTREILFNPQYDKIMTEGDRFNACMVDGGFSFLVYSHQFVRLLKASTQTSVVVRAIDRLERAYGEALAEIARHVDFDSFEVFDCDTLARVQLGSGLIALNSLLEASDRRR